MSGKEYNSYTKMFATWTAARAVNRGFTSTAIIRDALNTIGFHSKILKLAKRSLITEPIFRSWHCKITENLYNELCKHGIKDKVSFGRVSKIIAIYIKTVHILNSPYDSLSKFAHIPIDNILLTKLSERYNCKYFKKIKWTKLNRNQYYELIDKFKEIQKKEKLEYFWMLEKYWEI